MLDVIMKILGILGVAALTVVIALVLASGVYFGVWVSKEIQLSLAPTNMVQGKLLHRQVVTQGSYVKSNVSVWSCGSYGCIATSDNDVFRLGKEDSTLLIKQTPYETRIVGIQ